MGLVDEGKPSKILVDDMLYARLMSEAADRSTRFSRPPVQQLIDRGRLVAAATVLRRWDDPLAKAMLADLEWRIGHAAGAMQLCRDLAAEYPDDIEALDRLGRMAITLCDMEEAADAVSGAIARGMRHRDHITRIGIEAAWTIGRFDICDRLLPFVVNEGLRESLGRTATLAREAQEQLDPTFLDPAATGAVQACRTLVGEGRIVDAMAIIRARIMVGAPFVETMALGRIAHDLGPPNWQLFFWASGAGALRYPDDPTAVLARGGLLLKTGDIAEGTRLLTSIAAIDGPHAPDVATLLTFCRAAGGAIDEDLYADVVARARLRAPRTTALADPWLAGAPDAALAEGAPRAVDALDPVRRGMPPVRARRPRLAVCISGQLRSFRNTWATTQAALAEWEPVIFVDTWNNVGAGLGAHDTVDRMLPPLIVEGLSHDLRNRTKFERLFPTAYRSMMSFDKTNAEAIRAYCPVEHIRVHSEEEFEERHKHIAGIHHLGKLNQAKMFAMMANGDEQKSRYELETDQVFDAVLRLRPDRALHVLSADDVERATSRRIMLSDGYLPVGIGDQVFLSSSYLSTVVASIWPNMRDAGTPDFFPGASGRFQEFLLGEYLLANHVPLGRMAGTYAAPLSSPMLPIARLWEEAADDFLADAAGDPDSERAFRAVHQAAGRDPGFAAPAAKLQAVLARLG